MDDSISFYKNEVAKLNQQHSVERNTKKAKQISDETLEKLLG